MSFLKALGWIFIPYLMLPFQWKKIGKPARIIGSAYAGLVLIMALTSDPEEAKKANEQKPVVVEKTAAAPVKQEPKKKAPSPVVDEKPISLDFSTYLKSLENQTDLQKKEKWNNEKGKYVQWSGEIINVKEDGIEIKAKPDSKRIDFVAHVTVEEKSKLLTLNKGQLITIKGKLEKKGGLFSSYILEESKIISVKNAPKKPIPLPVAKKEVPKPQPKKETPKPTAAPEPKTEETKFLRVGEIGVLKEDTLIGASEEVLDELIKYSIANDNEGIMELAGQGLVMMAPKGTGVKLIDPGFLKSEIRVVSNGWHGYVPAEFVGPK
ncbi:hypothetical protein [Aneurinibacillus tyrosinisolvens]|uniref:hypothetical protein n=1 Tax=Aneurinibacillus tyrosinisolvens TaxID=1443435 RepID=UPI00063EE6F0|nr:hypothetical protein [Aneurinibacillus tyrosinisolvens]